jgi:23S rRNA (guanosine2251-2'-O)-methyltransferase
MAQKKKTKSKGKNRRDAHGVYERRALRGKASAQGRRGSQSRGERSAGTDRGERRSAGGRRSAVHDIKRNDRRFDAGSRGREYDRGEDAPELIVGRNPVMEALKSGRSIEKIYMAAGAEGSVVKIRALAKDAGVVVDTVPGIVLDRMAPGQRHQGVAAEISAYEYADVDDILRAAEEKGEDPFIVVLDGISDPHNLGAVIRTAECVGAHGVIIPKRNACGLTATVGKTSAGAVSIVPVARVTNIARTLEELKEHGIWAAAVDMDGRTYYEEEGCLRGPVAIVIGSEGRGISRLVKETCDVTVSIPLRGRINSLNASNAAAIVMYGIRRARDAAGEAAGE